MNRPRKWSAGQLLSSLSPAIAKQRLLIMTWQNTIAAFCIASHAAIILKFRSSPFRGRRLPLREEMMREAKFSQAGCSADHGTRNSSGGNNIFLGLLGQRRR